MFLISDFLFNKNMSSSTGYYLDDENELDLGGFCLETGRRYDAIMSFPDDSSTIANIIDEYTFEHQVNIKYFTLFLGSIKV